MLRNTFLNAQSGQMTQLGPGAILPNYPRLRLLKWRDMATDQSSRARAQKGYSAGLPRLSLALMTDPRRDLVNLTAVKPQVNHHRAQHISPLRSIIKKSRSINDISNIYASMYHQAAKNDTSNTSTLNNSKAHYGGSQEDSAAKKQLHARSQNPILNISEHSMINESNIQNSNLNQSQDKMLGHRDK